MFNKSVIGLAAFLLMASLANAQDRIVVEVEGNRWYWVNTSGDDHRISLDKSPKEIVLVIPDSAVPGIVVELIGDLSKEPTIISTDTKANGGIGLRLSDFSAGKVSLQLLDGQLIAISGRALPAPVKVTSSAGKLQIIIVGTEKSLSASVSVGARSIKVDPSFCIPVSDTNQIAVPLTTTGQVYHYLCGEKKLDAVSCSCKICYPSEYDYGYAIGCCQKHGNAKTSTYHLIYSDIAAQHDTRLSGDFTLLKLKRDRNDGFEYYKKLKRVSPMAYREMAVTVVGKKGTDYKVDVNGADYFMEYEKDFAGSLEKKIEKAANQADYASHQFTTTENSKELFGAEFAPILKTKILDLKSDLDRFNNVLYPVVDFIEAAYKADLDCLKQSIANVLEIRRPSSGEELSMALQELIKVRKIESRYYNDFCKMTQEVAAAFQEAVTKSSQYYIITQSFQIPNQDEITLTIKNAKGDPLFKPKTYMVSGGFKIDFSTGFFHSGISGADFITKSRPFRFKDTRDSILPSGRDSLIFLGDVSNDTLSVIQKNDKLSFGTGFYVHFYPRTGRNINIGGAAGALVDNNGRAQFLLGMSVMLSAGKNRIACVGGWARGREKALSADVAESYWDGRDRVFNSRNDLPKAYIGDVTPPTFDKWRSSWFFGLTFNFLSLPGKKEDE